MRLIFIRHGLAQAKKKEDTDLDDFRRELTSAGIRQTRRLARRYRKLFKDMDVLYTSPLLRAAQTAEIILRKSPARPLEIMVSLDKLCDAGMFTEELEKMNIKGTVGFVGHDPHLSSALKILLKDDDLNLEILKSGVVILEGKSLKELRLTALLSPLL